MTIAYFNLKLRLRLIIINLIVNKILFFFTK